MNIRFFAALTQIALLIVLALLGGCGLPYSLIPVAPERFTFSKQGHTLSIPIRTSHPLDTAGSQLTHLIIVVHGSGLNPDSSLRRGKKIAETVGLDLKNVMVAAPQFLQKRVGHDEKGVLVWDSKWRGGGESLSINSNHDLPRVSSFEVLDRLIQRIAAQGSLKRVTVLGHSAGGQFALRYAAINRIHDDMARQKTHMNYVVANPSSYLYLNKERYAFEEKGSIKPIPGHQLAGCPQYNNYKYGLDNLYGYAKSLPIAKIRQQLMSRPVLFLLGTLDNERGKGLDKTCSADCQGDNRFERGLLYKHHLQSLAPAGLKSRQQWLEIPGVGHSASKVFYYPGVAQAALQSSD
jgi:pimeloyl-ACP methyl ester carboxylesterase